MTIYKINDDLTGSNEPIFKAHYIHQIASNLLRFINNTMKEKEVKTYLTENRLVLYHQPTILNQKDFTIERVFFLFDLLIQQEDISSMELFDHDIDWLDPAKSYVIKMNDLLIFMNEIFSKGKHKEFDNEIRKRFRQE